MPSVCSTGRGQLSETYAPLLNQTSAPLTRGQSSSGDFSAVLFDVVSKRSSVIEGTLTIDHLNESLDELAASMGKQCVQYFGPISIASQQIIVGIYNPKYSSVFTIAPRQKNSVGLSV